ncbi:MAG: hypothetical protein V3T40_02175 [Nitrososphaerales archaeon]
MERLNAEQREGESNSGLKNDVFIYANSFVNQKPLASEKCQ